MILEGIDLLENAAGEETHETLWNLFHDPYQAPRILRRVGLCLANLAITDPQAREGIPDALHDDFKFESGRLIRASNKKTTCRPLTKTRFARDKDRRQ